MHHPDHPDHPRTDDHTEEDESTAISSDRIGHAGPGQRARTGTRDTSATPAPDDDAPPEQSTGGHEANPDGLAPRAGYPSLDPRSDEDEA